VEIRKLWGGGGRREEGDVVGELGEVGGSDLRGLVGEEEGSCGAGVAAGIRTGVGAWGLGEWGLVGRDGG